jgi:hypothetical protein
VIDELEKMRKEETVTYLKTPFLLSIAGAKKNQAKFCATSVGLLAENPP